MGLIFCIQNIVGADTKQGPRGLLGTKPFFVPHFFDYRKQPSFSLHGLPWVPMCRFKQLLIREGKDERQGEANSQEKQWCSPGARSWLPIKVYTEQYLWVVLQILKPPRWEKLTKINDGMLSSSLKTPDQLEAEVWWCWLPLTPPPTNQKKVHELITPSLNHYYKTPPFRTSLVAWWLDSVLPMPGPWVRSLVRELISTCHS